MKKKVENAPYNILKVYVIGFDVNISLVEKVSRNLMILLNYE